ncbi:MAG: carbohydrate-binding domain-containing protein [Clostridiales bacterium]|nr:carbohydrate-binding domain-containing protein [Clostridiales bacterium]
MKRNKFWQIILCSLIALAIACAPVFACSSSSKQFSGLSMDDKTVVYTGDKYTLEVDGLIDGASVSYTFNGIKADGVMEEGVYDVVAKVSKSGYTTKTLTATLTILEPQEMVGIRLDNKEFVYDGQKHSLQVEGAPEGATIIYTYNGERIDGAVEIGSYDVMAVVSKKGYKTKNLFATLLIAQKDEIIGVSLKGDTIIYDGQKHSLQVEGLPQGASVKYTYNGINTDGVTEEGEYEVVATISLDGYQDRVLTATFIIHKPKFTFTTSVVGNTGIPTLNTAYPALVNVPLEADAFSNKDLEASHTPISPVTVTLSASGATSNGANAKVDSSGVITISSAGSYYIKGNSKITSTAQIVVNDTVKSDNVYIVLQNAKLTNNGKAPLYVKSAKKVFLYLEGENSFDSTGAFPETDEDGVDATIFTRANLTIKGSGSLTITSVKKGIVAKDNLRVTGGTLTVNATARAIDANDCFSITNANVTLTSVNNDGATIENLEDATKGYFFMNSGSLNITSKKDGIQASGAFEVLGGTINIKSGGGSTVVSDPLLTSAKGIKATGDMFISGGSITIDASEDALHGSSSVHIGGGVLNLSSNKDAIDVDKAIVVDNATITSLVCSDGLKGESVTIKSGTVTIKSVQDGLKATEEVGDSINETTTTPVANDHACFINIAGGTISLDVEDNALDSKGNVKISGGELSIVGSSLGAKVLNYNGTAIVTGGKIGAVALKDKAVNFSSVTSKSLLIALDKMLSVGTTISIKKDGVAVFETTLTKQANSILIVNGLTSGEYDFTIGSNTESLVI